MFGGPWPRKGFIPEENLADLQRHQQEFLNRKAFRIRLSPWRKHAFSVVSTSTSLKLPTQTLVVMRVRQTEYDKGLDEILFNTVRDWVSSDWPFKKVDYPERAKAVKGRILFARDIQGVMV